jgi:hypothetical protein
MRAKRRKTSPTNPGVAWKAILRKESNPIRVILKETTIWTPEDPGGPPPMVLFRPSATLKIRTAAPNALSEMLRVLVILYQGRYTIQEEVASREWALIGSFGDSSQSGVIPIQFRIEMPQIDQSEIVAIYQRILNAGLRTQNYDKGLDKFVRKFDPVEEMSATVAVNSGWQGDHGWAVYFKQGARRCLLLETVDGLSSEEALWTALSSWATFSPRLAKPRQFPGRLFYPNEALHIIQDWSSASDHKSLSRKVTQ